MRSARRKPRKKTSEKKSNEDHKGNIQNDNEVQDKNHDLEAKRTPEIQADKGNTLFHKLTSGK